MKIGCDLVALGRLAPRLEREDFTQRVFHPLELEQCAARKDRLAALGARFAAKEALSKALGKGLLTSGIFPRDIWVRRMDNGCPVLECAPHVRQEITQLGYTRCEVSLSHDGDYAMATVLLC